MNYQDARLIAEKYLRQLSKNSHFSFEIIDSESMESKSAWVFFYESIEYLKNPKDENRLLGNAPIIVSKMNGLIYPTGTAYSIEYYLEKFERHGTCYPKL